MARCGDLNRMIESGNSNVWYPCRLPDEFRSLKQRRGFVYPKASLNGPFAQGLFESPQASWRENAHTFGRWIGFRFCIPFSIGWFFTGLGGLSFRDAGRREQSSECDCPFLLRHAGYLYSGFLILVFGNVLPWWLFEPWILFSSCVSAVFRSVKSSEIAGLLNRFGGNYKESFNALTKENQRAVTFYNNIVTNRHGVAHAEGSNVTFREVKEFYEEGHVVLDFLQEALFSRSEND